MCKFIQVHSYEQDMYLYYFTLTNANASALKRLKTKIKYLKYIDDFIDNLMVGEGDLNFHSLNRVGFNLHLV